MQQGSARGSFAAWAQQQVRPVPPVPPALVLVLPLVEVAAELQTPLEAKVADSLTDTMHVDALRCASTFLAMENLFGHRPVVLNYSAQK